MIYPRLSTGFEILVFFTYSRPIKFKVEYLAIFHLFSVIDSLSWFWLRSIGNNIQLMSFFQYIFMNFLLGLPEQASDLCQQVDLASELESNLRDTKDWERKLLLEFNAGKNLPVLFDWSHNSRVIDVKWIGIFFNKIIFMLGLFFSSKLNWGSYIVSNAKIASKKTEALFLPYGLARNTVVISRLVLLANTQMS